jgi:L-rhamnose mutarotase|tara:strand:+ start:89 stop:361 length:273 start_codon:yes stop_codon:yes gene_type:complete
MKIKDYRKFLNSLPDEFDDYELVHREYTDITDNVLNAQEVEVYSVHIDEKEKSCCNMHMESYELFNEFQKVEEVEVTKRITLPLIEEKNI